MRLATLAARSLGGFAHRSRYAGCTFSCSSAHASCYAGCRFSWDFRTYVMLRWLHVLLGFSHNQRIDESERTIVSLHSILSMAMGATKRFAHLHGQVHQATVLMEPRRKTQTEAGKCWEILGNAARGKVKPSLSETPSLAQKITFHCGENM